MKKRPNINCRSVDMVLDVQQVVDIVSYKPNRSEGFNSARLSIWEIAQ